MSPTEDAKMADRWTDSSMRHLIVALNEARRRNHALIEPEHLLWADLQDSEGIVAKAACIDNLSSAAVKSAVADQLSRLPVANTGVRSRPQYSPRLKHLLDEAQKGVGEDQPLDWPSVIGALMSDPDDPLVMALRDAGMDAANLQPVSELPARRPASSPDDLVGNPLSEFCRDLTSLAEQGRIEPVVGRDVEIAQIMLVLGQRTTSNPLLLGEPGVGKTAIVEGLALAVRDRPSSRLAGRRFMQLDLNGLLAGASYRGEFEERLKRVIDAVLAADGEYVLFVDEIHTLMGAGATAGGADAANLLKPALARGQLSMIGATTYSEYKKYLESDAAFTRRFQVVQIPEPTPPQVRTILDGISPRYEDFHGVKYGADALDRVVDLADRYIGSTHFPDKAIKLLDRAGVIAALADREKGAGPPIVTSSTVVEAVSQISNLPREHIAQAADSRLRSLRSALGDSLVGQDAAIGKLVGRMRLALSPWRNPARPRCVLLFSGPPAVGKTTAARILAEQVYAGRPPLSLDMSGYSEATSSSRLIGTTAGYVGYGEGGALTEAIWRAPYSLVLLEKIERAHPQVLELLSSAFQSGRLTDGTGKEVRMTESMFVMTSESALDALPASIRVWVDENVGFEALDIDHAPAVARLALQRSAANLAASLLHGAPEPAIELDATAEQAIREAFVPADGALSIERHVEQHIIGALIDARGDRGWAGVKQVIVRALEGAYTFDVLP
ncbi:UNVERIFIED_ORG: ATP-dependent Clp protease ATP-binding subunit ClpC [Bradyrhizobium japonicum]|uniref:AAA family ATPase n=1 Tax=Bradyrhizobium diazoefficiens TaxID=1355477 RepID=UPI003473B883